MKIDFRGASVLPVDIFRRNHYILSALENKGLIFFKEVYHAEHHKILPH